MIVLTVKDRKSNIMKQISLIITLLVLQACVITKNPQDQWIGNSKKNLIRSFGPPIRILGDGANGEVFIYGDQIYEDFKRKKEHKIAGPSYWIFTYVYIDNEGKIYSYKTDKRQQTPQEIVVQ